MILQKIQLNTTSQEEVMLQNSSMDLIKPLGQRMMRFLSNRPVVNILDFALSMATIQLCCLNTKKQL
jgi:hypothetical protein